MLLILIPLGWLAALAMLVCVCRVAADADGTLPSAESPSGRIGERLILQPHPSPRRHQARRHPSRFKPLAASAPARRRGVATHDIR
jgi:hypothetical protein